MAAGKVVSPRKLNAVDFNDDDGNDISISLSDFTCPICLQILFEPVIMPCEHELCGPCFKQNVEEANFLCPLCRMRISSWARRNSRNGTLVNSKRWEQIQKLFPENCRKRLHGEDDEDLFGLCIWIFGKFLFKLPPPEAEKLFKWPIIGPFQAIKCPPPPGNFSVAFIMLWKLCM